jgi:hypothetical protein
MLQPPFHTVVDIAPVTHDDDGDDPLDIVDAIDDAVITDAQAVVSGVPRNRPNAGRPWVRRQGVDARPYPGLDSAGKPFEVVGDRRQGDDVVRRRRRLQPSLRFQFRPGDTLLIGGVCQAAYDFLPIEEVLDEVLRPGDRDAVLVDHDLAGSAVAFLPGRPACPSISHCTRSVAGRRLPLPR